MFCETDVCRSVSKGPLACCVRVWVGHSMVEEALEKESAKEALMKRIGAMIFAVLLGIGTTSMAIAQSTPDKPKKPPASERSNKGGQQRGLDRADEVAGEHGKQGRERAREAQQNRPDKPERPAHGGKGR